MVENLCFGDDKHIRYISDPNQGPREICIGFSDDPDEVCNPKA